MKQSYLKQSYTRSALKLDIVKYIKINAKGEFTCIDTTRNTIKKAHSFGALPFGVITASTREEFLEAKELVLKRLKL